MSLSLLSYPLSSQNESEENKFSKINGKYNHKEEANEDDEYERGL